MKRGDVPPVICFAGGCLAICIGLWMLHPALLLISFGVGLLYLVDEFA